MCGIDTRRGEGQASGPNRRLDRPLGMGIEIGCASTVESSGELKYHFFSSCSLLPLKNMGIINEPPIKEIICGRKRRQGQSSSGVKAKLGDSSTLALMS